MKARWKWILNILLVAALILPVTACGAAPNGWQVSYDDRGGVTVTAGSDVVYTDVNNAMPVSGWVGFPWAPYFASPKRVDAMEGSKKLVTFSNPPDSPVQITKQITEISPHDLKILVRVVTDGSTSGNYVEYRGVLPTATYSGATFTTDGGGYGIPSISPLNTDWFGTQNGGHGDDMRYNMSTTTFNVKSLDGEPATLVYTFAETPISPGVAPNYRGWSFFNGNADTGAPAYMFRNGFQFNATAPFERLLVIRIKWKGQQ